MNTLFFLLDTAFSLYLMVVLLRFWLQWAKADFYNPLSQVAVFCIYMGVAMSWAVAKVTLNLPLRLDM